MSSDTQSLPDARLADAADTPIPAYLSDTYWWAYVHPRAVRVFERQWLVNLILWGNFSRLRDAALDELGTAIEGRTLQIACVYGNLTQRLLDRHAPRATLDVVDILPVQLRNLKAKLRNDARLSLVRGDSSALAMPGARYDRALLFFLLHEQPEEVRRATVAEALRVVKPGGKLVIVDYHRPSRLHPLYWPMKGILRALEPYALDLWRNEIETWLPRARPPARVESRTMYGGLYQMLSITV